jgi:hypothetical protein
MSAPATSKSTTEPLAPGVRFHDNATTISTETTVPGVTGVKIHNYVINVLAYVCNFLVVFLYTKTGLPDNGTLSNKYQTLVTPAPYAFAIWGIIFSAELVWTVAQCFEPYRSHPLVVKAVGYQFVFASLAQCAWTFAFGLEKLGLSLVCMVCILVPLLTIVSKISAKSSHSTTTTTTTKLEYWLLKFPFEIHASWIMAATLINVNVIAVGSEASEAIQTTIGWFSLVVLFGVGVYAVIQKQHYRRVWVVPCVLAWASYAISKELSAPRDKIIETFSLATIVRTAFASKIVAFLLILLVLVELTRSKFFSSEIEDESDVVEGPGSDGNGEYSSLNN